MKLYHTTPRKNRESILKFGLIPKFKEGEVISYEPRIFFSKKKNDIIVRDFINYWSDVDIWQVELYLHQIKKDLFSDVDYHYYTNEPIAPENVKLVKHITPARIVTQEEEDKFLSLMGDDVIMIKCKPQNLLDRIKKLLGIEWRFVKG